MSNTDIFDEMANDAVDASELPQDDNALSGIAHIAEVLQNQQALVDTTEEVLKQQKAELYETQTKTMPDAMMEVGLSKFTMTNGSEVIVKPFVSAKIKEDKKAEAHKWLDDNNFGDIIKRLVSVDFGRDQEAAARANDLLQEAGFAPSNTESVHAGTLKSWIKEQVEAGTPIPLELFGAFMGQKATIKKGK